MLLPKVLTINHFQSKNSTSCESILKQHISNNNVNSKYTFVRTLMNMNVIPQSDDLDDHLQDDIIINTVFDNDVDIDDLHSQSE